MGVGRQSRRVCFGAKPDKGFLDEISPYPEVVLKLFESRRTVFWWQESIGGWRGERGVGSWTGERGVGGWSPGETVGGRRAESELVAGPRRESWWLDDLGEGVETGQERGEQRGWRGSTEGQSTPDTGTERRGDKIGSSEEESQDVWFQ